MTKSISAIQEFIYRRTNHGPENSYICNAILRNYGAIKATVLATIMDRCFPKMDEWYLFNPEAFQQFVDNLRKTEEAE